MADRLTLIKSITSSLPIYTMQTTKLPVTICDKIDKINKDFLQGHDGDKGKVHLVDWESVCLTKLSGGLGVRKSAQMNQALLAKAAWKINFRENGMRARLLKGKYLGETSILNYSPKSSNSATWKGICYGAQILETRINGIWVKEIRLTFGWISGWDRVFWSNGLHNLSMQIFEDKKWKCTWRIMASMCPCYLRFYLGTQL